MKKTNRICLTCGKAYSYCPNCTEDELKPTWMALYDTENCREIFNTLTEYNAGIITAKVADERISKCDTNSAILSIKTEIANLKKGWKNKAERNCYNKCGKIRH